ncbi:MAG: hypothetical protein K2M34_00655 [Alphaproteobacteria bacterium]|nr:hypothetical protein [Alphaproteobacteria bacterium]
MKYSKYLFIVSAIAMVSGANAYAAAVTGLATPNYVDGAINSLPSVARTGSYNDLADKPSIPAAQVNADWNAISGKAQILNKPTLGALAAKATISNADVATNAAIATSKISGLDTALSGKQATANIVNPVDGKFAAGDSGSTTKYPSMKAAEQIAATAAAGAITELSGDIEAVQSDVDKLAATVEANKNALGKLAAKDAVGSADITDGSIAAADLASNSVTTVKITDKNVTKAKLEDSVQTSLDKADNSLQKAASATFTNGHVLKADASGNVVDGGALGTLATKNAIASADITDGTIVNADISASAAIATSKISGLDTALAGKQATANIVNPVDGKFAAGDETSETKYPSMKAAKQLAATAAAGAVTELSGDIEALQGEVTDLAATVDANKKALGKLASKDAVGSADITDGSIAAADLASNSVTTVKIADSNVTTAKLAAGAVTAAKTSGVIGKIPSGSATSTTFADIWVQ